MTAFLVLGVTVALLGVAALGFVTAGILRGLTELRRLELAPGETHHQMLGMGLNAGEVAPSFDGMTLSGEVFSSRLLSRTKHLIIFARPGCPPCETLAPAVIKAAKLGRLPPTIIVSQAAPSDHGPNWMAGGHEGSGQVEVVLETHAAISSRYGTTITPHSFLIGEDGRVAAQGTTDSISKIEDLMQQEHKRPREV